jgi:hypothetical protein
LNIQCRTWSSKAATNFVTTEHTNHTKKIIVNFLLRKNLTIDFVKNVQKNKNMADCITEYPMMKYGQKALEGAFVVAQFIARSLV